MESVFRLTYSELEEMLRKTGKIKENEVLSDVRFNEEFIDIITHFNNEK